MYRCLPLGGLNLGLPGAARAAPPERLPDTRGQNLVWGQEIVVEVDAVITGMIAEPSIISGSGSGRSMGGGRCS